LAAALHLRSGATILPGDDFYWADLPKLTPAQRQAMNDAEVADAVMDWPRLRTEALEPLTRRQPATYRPYDWAADDGSLAAPRTMPAADLVVCEGIYTARSELSDLVQLAVYVDVDVAHRSARLRERADRPEWAAFWDRGESFYLSARRPPASFDLRVSGSNYATLPLRN
jgi:uridine kinase